MKLLFVGFGTVGQGLAELLLEKEKSLADNYGFEFKVVGIPEKGCIVNCSMRVS